MVFKQLLQAEAIDICQIDSCRLAGWLKGSHFGFAFPLLLRHIEYTSCYLRFS
ncbi:hypothetical protein F5051DRAFT_409319 [Lentinula edodes]|nr:hypothetical protein F5051DRAFT_409319 [Lentinula edodes]